MYPLVLDSGVLAKISLICVNKPVYVAGLDLGVFPIGLWSIDINLSIFKKDGSSIDIRTYENGVGETLSCGSAALCVASYFLKDKLLKIRSIGGELVFKKNKNGILMAGPASFIYRGNISD